MYVPAFLEIFVGLVIVLVWSRWLRDRRVPRTLVQALPWIAGAAVILGQMAAVWALISSLQGGATGSSEAVLRWGRWGSFGTVVACLMLDLGFTVWSFVAKEPKA